MWPGSLELLDLYRHYQNGLLPIAGGILDQPAVYYSAMLIIDREIRRDGGKN